MFASQIAKMKLATVMEVEHMLESVWLSWNVTVAPVIHRSLPVFILHDSDTDKWVLNTMAHTTSPIYCPHAMFCVFEGLHMWI